jgi:AcrR family transcriptional regulator
MAKSGPRTKGIAGRPGAVTKKRIVNAALKTLKQDGFTGASARVIARNGRFNPALIFYHFGSVNDLLLAALDETSRLRMTRYRDLMHGAKTLPQVMEAAAKLYEEDLRSGHITVLAEMIAGAASIRELGPQIVERIQPWIQMTEETLRRVVEGTPLEQIAPPNETAFAVVSLYLGMELLTHLEGDSGKAEALFKLATNLTGLLGTMFGTSSVQSA